MTNFEKPTDPIEEGPLKRVEDEVILNNIKTSEDGGEASGEINQEDGELEIRDGDTVKIKGSKDSDDRWMVLKLEGDKARIVRIKNEAESLKKPSNVIRTEVEIVDIEDLEIV